MSKTQLKLAPIYTEDLKEIYNVLSAIYNTPRPITQDVTAVVNVNNIECTLVIENPMYNFNNNALLIANHPTVQIYTPEYNCTVSINFNTQEVTLKDIQTDIIIHTYAFSTLDAIQTLDDVHANNTQPFIQQVLTAYQILKLIPDTYQKECTQMQIVATLINNIVSKLEHFGTREYNPPFNITDMNDISSVLNFINDITEEKTQHSGDASLQIQSVVQGTTCITTIGKDITVTIINPEDANLQYSITFNARESTIVYVTNNKTNEVLYKIPTFVLDNTDFTNEEELNALRSTYNLYDGINTGYKVLNYFQHKGTVACTDYADAIKQAYYRAIL